MPLRGADVNAPLGDLLVLSLLGWVVRLEKSEGCTKSGLRGRGEGFKGVKMRFLFTGGGACSNGVL